MPATILNAPLEMLGTHPGVNIIDPSTVLTRLWYFDGKFLRASGFRLDQDYVRSLVALSNQATGHGLVHGFDVRLLTGDRLAVEGGLALAPSGRVVYLPGQIELAIATLIARSTGDLDPGERHAAGVSEFAPCPPDAPGDPETPLPPRPLYVLTVAAAEALCGEEERFGQLCEDACATETDRSVAVEGVRFRVRELHLALPSSSAVPFAGEHLRSRVASAWFRQERTAIPSMISGAGLQTGIWCDGAEGVGGEEIALAVFDRSGQVTTWLDMWTARRELIETSPHRYWQWRLDMRPSDVFLAQLLQFQCQLVALGATGGSGPGPGEDPCREERAALVAADALLAEVPAADAIDKLRVRIATALSKPVRGASGSLLVDGGIVELPPGGYLPTDLSRDVRDQVAALMGPGVDLRFCAVRADFVPEALLEAQHMERISLTRGIDDPAQHEEVDVLVPDGVVEQATPTATEAYEGIVRFLPRTRREIAPIAVSGAALTMAAVARDQVQPGWSWSLAAHGEMPEDLGATGLIDAVAVDIRPRDEAQPAETVTIPIQPDATFSESISAPSFRFRMNRERLLARERYEAVLGGAFEPATAVEFQPDRPLRRGDERPVALWIDVEVDRDLRELAIGDRASCRGRLSVYSRSEDDPVVIDAQVAGSLLVTSSNVIGTSGGGTRITNITTTADGFVDLLLISGGNVDDRPPQAVKNLTVNWRVGATGSGARILAAGVEFAPGSGALARFDETGSPADITGVLDIVNEGRSFVDTGEWVASSVNVAATGGSSFRYADLSLGESLGALDPGANGRDLAEAVIDIIGTELALRGRDPSFAPHARRRMFERPEGSGTTTVRATRDWVMFHRRRNKVCGDVAVEQPKAIRKYRWFHAVIDDPRLLKRFATLAGTWSRSRRASADVQFLRVRDRVDQLGFEPVTTLEFVEESTELHSSLVALRADWNSAPRGSRLHGAAVGERTADEGPNVVIGRLMSAMSAVADLIDTSQTLTEVLAEIPPEYQSVGIHGAIFTVGVEQPTQAHIARLYRMTRSESARFEDAVRDVPTLDETTFEDLFRVLDIDVDIFDARYTTVEVDNHAELATWWGTSTDIGIVSVVSADVLADAAAVAEWRDQRLPTLAGHLGAQGIEFDPSRAWVSPHAEAIVLVVVHDRR
jgi:hypothetical protein